MAYYLKAGNSLIAPGFLQYDNISYIAYARQYLDSDDFSFLYSNPFNDSPHYPKIYFQFQNFIFLLLLKMQIPPGIILIFFTIVFSFIFFKIIIRIFDHLMPRSRNRVLSIILFSWGGGLLTLAGVAGLKFISLTGIDNWDRLFVLDPSWGWWGLNIGRSLIFSTEAYYHALFFGSILCILKKSWKTATALSFVLFLSHPYTGIEYLSIIVFWLFIEIIIKRNKEIPGWFGLASLFILIAHIGYYLVFLNQYPEHQSVHEQCSIPFVLSYKTLIPAYCIVGVFALIAIRLAPSLRTFFSTSHNRLFASWFLIAFLLINHELFMPAMEPAHFTRGYVWSALFLLGLPALEQFLNYIKQRSLFVLGIFILLFLSDNFLWLANYTRKKSVTHPSVYISKEQKAVLHWLRNNTNSSSLIISSDRYISLFSTIYTKAYPWISHNLATPFLAEKQKAYNNFIQQNIPDTAWHNREAIFVLNRNDSLERNRANNLFFRPDTLIQIHQYSIITARLITNSNKINMTPNKS